MTTTRATQDVCDAYGRALAYVELARDMPDAISPTAWTLDTC